MKILIIIFFYYVSTISAFELQSPLKVEANKTTIEKMRDLTSGKIELSKDIAPKELPINIDDNETKLQNQKAWQAYYSYKIRGFEHRSEVFQWQLFSSKLLFVIVIVLVFSGICFAAIQFYAGLKENKINNQNTKLILSPKSIEVSSPVIGLIILALSLGFFYLYLVYVFPIEEIF